MGEGVWVNGKKVVTGHWAYNWASDRFQIVLNTRDSITGGKKRFVVVGDSPEWGNWKLARTKRVVEVNSGHDSTRRRGGCEKCVS